MVFLNGKSGMSGFTLIEVLVSMMVMAISMTVIMSLFSGGLRSKKRAYDYNTAVDLANNKIQEVLLEQTIEPGIQEGRFENDYSWKMEIIPDKPEVSDSEVEIPQTLEMYIITIEIRWKYREAEKIYTISTLHMEERRELDRIHAS